MPLTIGSIASYALTVAGSASFGFVANGVISGGKVSELHHRLDHVQSLYEQQAVLLSDMAELLRQVTVHSANFPLQSSVANTLASAEQLPSRI